MKKEKVIKSKQKSPYKIMKNARNNEEREREKKRTITSFNECEVRKAASTHIRGRILFCRPDADRTERRRKKVITLGVVKC